MPEGRTNPALWERSKQKAIRRLGGRHSARAMQLAGRLYRQAGGRYSGRKTKAQKKLSKWTSEKWTTYTGKPARKGRGRYDRYLPRAAWAKLTPAQVKATRQKKLSSRHQYVSNTAAARKAGKQARR